MKLDAAVNLEDLHRLARRRLPRVVLDFIEGGVDDEDGLARNVAAFRRYRLLPRYLVDVAERDQSTELFGRRYAGPFGISPTGLAALFRPGADMMLAEAARKADVPVVLSCNGTASIEDLARTAPEHGWFQLYPARDKAISDDMVRRAADAGLSTLVLGVDVPVHANRERNIRNGFGRPLKLSLADRIEALGHPAWLAGYLRHGYPEMANWTPYAGPGAGADRVAAFSLEQHPAQLTWQDVERYRRLWPRSLAIKGLLDPADGRRAADLGVDGIVVSNHGARQLDRAPASLEALAAMREAVGERLTLMLDSGVRRGADVVVALCLGAKLVFLGRPTLYGAIAAGTAGAARALAILRREVDLVMAQMGCPTIADLGPDRLLPDGLDGAGWPSNRAP